MEQRYFKGEIYYIYPRDTFGSEQRGGRPAIIISNDVGNEYSKIVEVVFLTTREKKPLPTHVEINSAKYPSIALCEQIETVSKERIGNYINSVTQNELNDLERAILVSLDINSNIKGSKKLEAWEKMIQEWENEEVVEIVEENEEALKDLEEDLRQAKALISIETENIEANPQYIKVCAERDIYKELYMDLLNEKKRIA